MYDGCWLALGFWGKRGGLQSRAGLDWAGPRQERVGGWVCGWKGGEVVSFWDAGLRTGWAARGDTEVQEGPSRASIDEVSRKEKIKNKKPQGAELIIMAADAMHMRGPRLIRHVYSRSFLTVRTVLVLTRQEKEKERERESEREGPHPRIKVPMFQAAHAITICRWVDWGRMVDVCTNPPENQPALGTALWNPPFTTTLFFLRPGFSAPCPSLN